MFDYLATRRDLETAANELFDVVKRDIVAVHIGQTYPLHDVARAHRDLEARRTSGSTVLLP
jgi:NADPH2:quinone reductase